MFDWLFGTKRQTSEDEARTLYDNVNTQRNQINQFYDSTFDDENWNTLNDGQRNYAIQMYNALLDGQNLSAEGYNNYLGALEQEDKDNRYNYFGNGMLGMLLNPIGQTVTAGVDLATGNYEGRDAMSDLGALGETALTFLPGIGLAGKGAKAFGSVAGNAGLGAGFGAANALKEGGSDTNFGDILSQAGTGALFGGGIGFAGNKLGGMMRNRGANNIVGKYMADNPTGAKAFLDNNMTGQLRNQVAKQPNFLGNYGGLYGNAMGSLVPKSRFGKVAAGGAGLYGGMKLLGGGESDPMMTGGYDPYGANYDQYGGF